MEQYGFTKPPADGQYDMTLEDLVVESSSHNGLGVEEQTLQVTTTPKDIEFAQINDPAFATVVGAFAVYTGLLFWLNERQPKS
ncbi:hypothetical protein BH23PAT2_BH23PAT2_04910 [soil metagenome]